MGFTLTEQKGREVAAGMRAVQSRTLPIFLGLLGVAVAIAA